MAPGAPVLVLPEILDWDMVLCVWSTVPCRVRKPGWCPGYLKVGVAKILQIIAIVRCKL